MKKTQKKVLIKYVNNMALIRKAVRNVYEDENGVECVRMNNRWISIDSLKKDTFFCKNIQEWN
jgi:hypothetical protein